MPLAVKANNIFALFQKTSDLTEPLERTRRSTALRWLTWLLNGTANCTEVKWSLLIMSPVFLYFCFKSFVQSTQCALIEKKSVPQSRDKLTCWFFQKQSVKNVPIILNNSIVFFWGACLFSLLSESICHFLISSWIGTFDFTSPYIPLSLSVRPLSLSLGDLILNTLFLPVGFPSDPALWMALWFKSLYQCNSWLL